jgi:hypothetical protein
MKKILMVVLFLSAVAAFAGAQELPRGESAIFLKNGQVIIDHIVSYSNSSPIVRTRNQEINVQDIYLINYEENAWDYPAEREQMDGNAHFIFLNNGNVIGGQIVSYRKQDDVKARTPWGFAIRSRAGVATYQTPNVKRVYFANALPNAYQNQGQSTNRGINRGRNRNQGQVDNPIVGSFGAVCNTNASQLQMNADGTARLVMNNGQSIGGTWMFNRGDTSIIVLRLNNGGSIMEMTFGRDGNDLVGLNYDKKMFGQLRFRR